MESISQPHWTQIRIQELDGVKFARFDVPHHYQGHTFAVDAFGESVPTEKIPVGPYSIKMVLTSEFLAHFSSIEKFKSDEGFSHLLVPRKIAEAKIKFWYVNSHGKREGTIQLKTKEGRLCAIYLDLPETEIHDAVRQASQTVSAILDAIALRARIPLQIRHLEVTCAHEPQFRRSYLTIPYSDAWLEESDIVSAPLIPQRLCPAIRLFREAISSSKPHYRLLCLYRASSAREVHLRKGVCKFSKDRICGGCPNKGFGVFVVLGEVGVNGGLKLSQMLSGQDSGPDFRRVLAAFPISGLRLNCSDFLRQLNASNRHGRCLESVEPEHRPDPLRYSPVILLDHIVEVFAGSHLYAAR